MKQERPVGTILKHRKEDGEIIKMYLPSDVTSSDQINLFARFLVACGYSMVSVQDSMTEYLDEYGTFHQRTEEESEEDLVDEYLFQDDEY